MNRILQFGNTAGRPSPRSQSLVSGWGRGLLSLLTAGMLSVGVAQAQTAANYAFSQSTGNTYTPITGGAVLGTATNDDNTFAVVPIGFSFTYLGTAYTTLSVNTNGGVRFGATTSSYTMLASSTLSLAALNRDLQGTTVNASELSYLTTGTSPTRTFVVQWKGYRRYYSTTTNTDNLNFQIRLVEGSNIIQFAYGSNVIGGAATTTNNPQAGINGAAATDFNDRTSTTSWTATTAGTANTATVILSSTVVPPSGLLFSFTPPAGCTGTPTAGTAAASPTSTCSTSTITLTGGSTGVPGLSYQLQSSPTSGGTYTNVGSASSTPSFTATPTGTTFYRIVTTCTNSSSSANSAPVQVTTPGAPTYATVPYTQNFEAAWITRCSTRDVPDGSWAQSPSTGNNTFRRYDDGMASGAWTNTSGAYTPAGSNAGGASSLFSARFHSYQAALSTQSLFDLYANVSGGAGTPTLMFDYINTTGTDKLEVLFSTDGGATFGAALFTQAVAASWTSYTVPLTGATATSVVRFRATSDFGTTDIGLDNVNVSIVGCGQVTGLMAGSITATSASLSFTAPSGATDYTVTYTPQGGTAQTVSPNPMASPVALSGLMAGTLYTVGVITNCGGSSSTAATTTFTTAFACATPTYATLPYTQGFENTWLSNCALRDVPDLSWKNTPSTADADASFRRDDDGVSANWTSPTFGAFTPTGSTNNGATGTHSARFHSSYATAGTIGLFDLYVNATGGTGTPTVSFDYINTSGTDKLEVLVSTDGGVTFGAAQFTQVLSAAWTTYNVALTGATATTVVRLRATGDFGSTDIGLDNVNVSFVACPAVSNLMAGSITTTSAQLTFTAPSGASSYIVTYTGGGATTTVTPAPTASPVSLTGLMPSTAYSVSVRSDCGGGLTSTAVMTSFTTLTPPPSNDECAGAISLNSSSSTCTATTGSTIAATASTAAGTCAGTADDDVWFSFVASSVNQVIKVVGNSSFDAVVNLRSGTCPGTTVGSCADATAAGGTETITATGLTVGVTYYVRVYSYSSTAPTTAAAGGFTICVTAPADLVVSGTQTIPAGTYNNITIPSGAVGTLGGTVTVLGTFLVQADGQLNTACQTLNGSGAFTLDAGGKLGICSTSGLSSTAATGAVQMTGPRSFSTDGVYIFNGTAAQSTGNALPATVRSLTTTTAANVTLLQPVAVRQLVSVAAAGNIVTTTTNKLTLLSVIGGGTALVANTSTGAVTGAGGVMQRAVDVMNPENIGYHHYSSPVASTTMDDLAVPGIYTPVFNGAAYNSATTVGVVRPFPTVFGYNQARVGTTLATDQVIGGNAFNQGFEAPIDGTDPIVPGKGYTANVPNAANVDFVGTFNNAPTMATVFPGLSNLARNSHPNGGYHLLGNPFPSPINAATMAPTLTNMNDELHVFHSDSRYGGMYSSYIISTGVGTTSPSNGPSSTLIPAGAAFLMRVITPGAIGAVALTNANRITTFVGQPQPAFGRQTSTRALLQLQVSGAGRTDDLYFYTEAQATAGVDGQYDATKVTNPNGLNLATLTCSTQLAIDARPALTTATIVPMFIGMPAVGSYTLAVANLANFGTTAVYLRDALTGTRTLLAAGTAYRFTTTTTTAAGRFALEFAPVGTALATAAQSLDAQVQLYPNPTSNRFHVVLPAGAKASSATMSNALGQTVLTRNLTSNEADFDVHGLATGIYTLRLMVDGNAVTRKVVVE